jgi:ketosteroid isomerase-like protein
MQRIENDEVWHEVDDFGEQWCGYFMAGNVDAFVQMYTEDAKLAPPGVPTIEGHDAIRAHVRQFLSLGVKSVHLTTLDVVAGNDLVTALIQYEMTIAPPGAEAVEENGRYLVVFQRGVDSRLRARFDFSNSARSVC